MSLLSKPPRQVLNTRMRHLETIHALRLEGCLRVEGRQTLLPDPHGVRISRTEFFKH